MTLTEAHRSYVFKAKIDLDDKGNYVEFRELSMRELNEVQRVNRKKENGSENYDEMFAYLAKIMPDCIVDSSIKKDDGTEANGKQVADVIMSSGTLGMRVAKEWFNALPFSQPESGSK